jgi:hypothetical protein
MPQPVQKQTENRNVVGFVVEIDGIIALVRLLSWQRFVSMLAPAGDSSSVLPAIGLVTFAGLNLNCYK